MGGGCAWNNGNSTSAAKGGKPSGVTLTNSYGRCKIGSASGSSLSDGALPIGAYYYNGTALTANGLTTAGTYENVAPKVFCSGNELPVTQFSCPKLTLNAGCDHVFTSIDNNTTKDVNIGDCIDVEYDWVPANCNQYHCDPSPAMAIECQISPNFTYQETHEANKLGYVELSYNGTTNKSNGSENYAIISMNLKAQQNASCSGTNCNSYQGETFEFSGIVADAYLSANNGTTKDNTNGKVMKCKLK